MFHRNLLSACLALLTTAALAPTAHAGRAWRSAGSANHALWNAPTCDTYSPYARVRSISRFTNYTPGQGDPRMQGTCTSSTPGIDACQGRLDDYEQGRAKFVVVATQQHGGSAEMFGCWGRLDAVQAAIKGDRRPAGSHCIIAAFADHYARSENQGQIGVNGQLTGVKMDVSTNRQGQFNHEVNRAHGTVQCIGRLGRVTNHEKPNGSRRIVRDPVAWTD